MFSYVNTYQRCQFPFLKLKGQKLRRWPILRRHVFRYVKGENIWNIGQRINNNNNKHAQIITVDSL